MPTYTYRCKTCGSRFETVQSMTDDALAACPVNGGPLACESPGEGEVAKVFGAVGITFKGSGFYKTDSRGSKTVSSKRNGSDSADKTAEKASTTSGSNAASSSPASSGSGSSGSSSSGSGSSGGSSSGSGSASD